MKSLKTLSLGGYIRSQLPTNNELFSPMTTTYEDMKNIWNFLAAYEGMLKNTPETETVRPSNGLDGKSLFVDQNAISGFLYNSDQARPKTISEVASEVYRAIDIKLLSSDTATEIAAIKDAIGLSKFYDEVPSAESSTVADISSLDIKITQLAADIFNRETGIGDAQDTVLYNFDNAGKQTQENSIKDLVMLLIDAHGGLDSVDHTAVTASHVWGLSVPSSLSLIGLQEKFTTVFASGNTLFEDFADAQRFYNPFTKDVKIKTMSISVPENTLVTTTSVTLYVNGSPTGFDIKIPAGNTGQFNNSLQELTLEPNDYIQFKISTGSSPSEYIKVLNFSVIIEETN